ncbi:MAG: branched-chain amino acid ABC transporter permease [Desulfobacteraceae bacterium]|nr:branched-chain amino acid ABC transporter permease [Desulfobacteraceae bacterium]
MFTIILQLIVNGLLLGGIYALVAIGLTLIFGVVRIINFAQGDFLMIGMFASFWLFYFFGIDPYISILLVAPAVFLFGVLTQRVIIKPLLNAPTNSIVFATFGLSIVLQNTALLLCKSDPRAVDTSYSNAVFLLGDVVINIPRLVILAVAVAIVIVLYFFLQRTYWGKALTAVAQDREAAILMGVNIHKVYMVAFGLGVGLEAVAGALLLPIYSAVPTVGFGFTIMAFVVVVLGGMGSMFGAFLAGLIIGLVEVFSGFFISPQLQGAIYYIIFVIVLIMRPQGLMGKIGAQEMGFK